MSTTKTQIDFNALAGIAHRNVTRFPAVAAVYADRLRLPVDVCMRMGLGVLLSVPLKAGGRRTGRCFTVPERDATGSAIGLSVREVVLDGKDSKVTYLGSSRGLIFEVNPAYAAATAPLQPDTVSWVGVEKTGRPCPICGKPDFCSVVDEPDPRAAVCRRQEAGSKRRSSDGGFIHELRPPEKPSVPVLAGDPAVPVVVVEGATDVEAVNSLGLVGVGRPSNVGGLDILPDVIRGRLKVIIVGENDAKPNGQCPGRIGMIAAFKAALKSCRDVVMVMPPAHVKDFRVWRNNHGLTSESFLAYVAANGQSTIPGDTLGDNDPMTVAEAFVRDVYQQSNTPLLRQWHGGYYLHEGGVYIPIEDAEVEKAYREWAVGKTHIKHTTKGDIPEKLPSTITVVQNALAATLPIIGLDRASAPCWINDKDGPAPHDLIVFANGILDVSKLADGGKPAFRPPSPHYFSLAGSPVLYDGTAACQCWMKYLRETLGDEPKKVDLLQEWMGYCLTADNSLEKMLWMKGEPGSGKGTAEHVMEEIFGDSYAATRMAAIASRFGMEPLLGKLVASIPDAKLPHGVSAADALERILAITGGDAIEVDRKNKTGITLRHATLRLMIVSNDLLSLPDTAHALVRRIIFLPFDQDFTGNPDISLRAKLSAERPGIVNWAVEGLARLRRNGKFTVPDGHAALMEAHKEATNPAYEFVNEHCVIGDELHIPADMMHDAAKAAHAGRDDGGWTKSQRSVIRTLAPIVKSRGGDFRSPSEYDKHGKAFRNIKGIALTAEAIRVLLGRPEGR